MGDDSIIDAGFWIMWLIITVPAFCGGYLLRSWVEFERKRRAVERARRRHPATRPQHWRVVD